MRDETAFRYQSGFGNFFSSEALPGALPAQNSPQRCPFGLYAEQLSSTAFTAPRAHNRHTWLYRIRPSVMHAAFVPLENLKFSVTSALEEVSPNPLRWDPIPFPERPTDFLEGLISYGANGTPEEQSGIAIHLYAANRSMTKRAFYDADGEWLIVPQEGRLRIITELGRLCVEPQEIVVIPRGIRFRVELSDGPARGYVCENYGAPFRLPDLGPIGANGLACERDFLTPEAWYEEDESAHELVARIAGRLWTAQMDHSPFDVVAWRGNSAPYKYDLRRFNTMGSVSFDHPDPSIFLVLQAVSPVPGVDDIDFVIFPPRWLAMEHTFRPPWFHRNIASEFMGLIHGVYDAKAEGFLPGGASLHNCMSGHGPDAATFESASRADTSHPQKVSETMAFMFETRRFLRPTRQALDSGLLQRDYAACWHGLEKRFDPHSR